MQKRAPTLGNILVIILFALSCFGLLMFLWGSFGGPLPLKPKGYRFTIAFPRTLALAEQSDVRISGVNVGHVIALHLGKDGRTHATVELSGKYAPIRANMHAILRQKTLLGETFVQLIPEGNTGPALKDEGQLANAQVEPSVTLDDILSAFDPKTRRAFAVWQQALAAGIHGRGEQINASFAQLEPFVENANRLVTILNSQEGAVRALVRNTGVVFNALASRDHQLEGLITNGERTFHAAAEGSKGFAEAFQALPAFEHNSTVALRELDSFATIANPYFDEFRPTERQLSQLLRATEPFAPEFDRFLTTLGPLTKAAKRGLPDVKKTLDLTVPVLENLRPVLHNLDPFLQYTGEYVPEVQAFFANLTAASESHGRNGSDQTGPSLHLLTSMNVLGPESLALYPSRIGTDRSNPYFHTGALHSLPSGLPVYSSSSCSNSAPAVSGPANETISESIIEQIIQFKAANAPEHPNEVPAPVCLQQGPFTFNGQTSQFPHVTFGG
ncbi:MAG TPA: MlaD family protein [Solirubrobacteraceae bacterium]|jgi:virulence factor Mce-like protein